MTTTTKRPPIKETVGAQYICFATKGEPGEFTGIYEQEVEKTEVVKKVDVSENSESTAVRASGKIYVNNSQTSGTEISVEVVAFPSDTTARMRGDTVTPTGLVLSGANTERPFFGYGKTVQMKGGQNRYDWYPKCQLSANTDNIESADEKFKEQNDTLTIMAMPFDDEGNIQVSIKEDMKAIEGLTEEKFFSSPIMNEKDFKKILNIDDTNEGA